MIRTNVDVYIGGQKKFVDATIAHQGDVIRVTNGNGGVARFTEVQQVKSTVSAGAWLGLDESGKRVDIAALERRGCGCGKK